MKKFFKLVVEYSFYCVYCTLTIAAAIIITMLAFMVVMFLFNALLDLKWEALFSMVDRAF